MNLIAGLLDVAVNGTAGSSGVWEASALNDSGLGGSMTGGASSKGVGGAVTGSRSKGSATSEGVAVGMCECALSRLKVWNGMIG